MVEGLGDNYDAESVSENKKQRGWHHGSGKKKKKNFSHYFLIHPENNHLLTFFDFYLAVVNLWACVSVAYYAVFEHPDGPLHTLAESIITLSFIAELLTKCCRMY